MSAVSAYIDRIGKQQLYRDLDVDRDRGNFIKSRALKFTYQTLFSAAQYIVAFLLLFITLTQQLASVNIFEFIQKSQHIYLFGSIISICLLIHIIRQFYTKVAQTTQQKKWSSLVIDILKIIACFLSYYFINQQYVVPSHTTNIKYSGCILFILFIVFAVRKVLFWIIFTVGSESQNVEPWNQHVVQTEAEGEIDAIQKKIKGLISAIGQIKGKVNQGAKADEKSKDS